MKLAQVTFSPHFIAQAIAKGFTAEQIASAIEQPEKVTEVRRYVGQQRYCGAGVAIVLDGNRAVTLYADGIVTPLREDQKSDRAALNSKRVSR